MDAQSIAIHEGCVDKRPRALSYSHTLPEQGQLATYKRVISSEKIDSGLPLSDSCVCVRERESMCISVLHTCYTIIGRMNVVPSILYFQFSAFPWIFKVDLQSLNRRVLKVKILFIFNCLYSTSAFVETRHLNNFKQRISGELLHKILKRDHPPIMKLLLP